MQRPAKIIRFPHRLGVLPPEQWWEKPSLMAALIFAAILLLHLPLLSLPYFWDEAGYYIPAARDILFHFQLIPTSTLTNAHPPLVMLWLAAAWKLFGYYDVVTRVAMLLVATFTLTGVFRLAKQVANSQVAIASVVVTAMFPVFFAQSTLAHLDLAAAGFTLWGVAAYFRDRYPRTAIWFALAALAKETAVLAPLALVAWEVASMLLRGRQPKWFLYRGTWLRITWLLVSIVPLAAWFAYHYHETGIVFGNPEFVRYNVASTLHPLRIAAALAQRVWQLFGYMNMFVLTIAFALAMTRKAISDSHVSARRTRANGNQDNGHRPRISIPVQLVFLLLVVAYALAMSVVGGAVLARYLLPVYPMIVIVFVSTLWRRVPWWPGFVAVVTLAFAVGLVVNPPYHFAPEDNLNYAEFVRLHQDAAHYIETHPPGGRVLTAWPGSDELTKPYLGYVNKPYQIVAIENFSSGQVLAAREAANQFDAAFVFSTKYEPASGFIIRLPFWEQLQKRYFGYHVDLPPSVIASLLQGHVLHEHSRGGQWVAVIQMDRAANAKLLPFRAR